MIDKRDFREETNLNAAEERLLVWAAAKMGISKSAALRMALLRLGDDLVRQERLTETGIVSGE